MDGDPRIFHDEDEDRHNLDREMTKAKTEKQTMNIRLLL